MGKAYPRIQFRVDEELHDRLQERSVDGNLNITARRDLIRACAVMDHMGEKEFDRFAKNVLRDREDEKEWEARQTRQREE